MLRTLLFSPKFGQTSSNGLSFFHKGSYWEKNYFFEPYFFLVLLFQEVEKGYVPKFSVLIFNLALVIKK